MNLVQALQQTWLTAGDVERRITRALRLVVSGQASNYREGLFPYHGYRFSSAKRWNDGVAEGTRTLDDQNHNLVRRSSTGAGWRGGRGNETWT